MFDNFKKGSSNTEQGQEKVNKYTNMFLNRVVKSFGGWVTLIDGLFGNRGSRHTYHERVVVHFFSSNLSTKWLQMIDINEFCDEFCALKFCVF